MPPARGEMGKPVMTVCGGQSGCGSASSFENKARFRSGEWHSLKGFPSVARGKSSSAPSRYHGLARVRVARAGPEHRRPEPRAEPAEGRRQDRRQRISVPSSTEKKPTGASIVETQGTRAFSATSRAA